MTDTQEEKPATIRGIMALASHYAAAWHRDESIDNPRTYKVPEAEQNLRDYVERFEAQSAEKIARLEAEKEVMRKQITNLGLRHQQDRQKLAAAELSNTQLRDVLEDFARGQLQVPNFEAYVQATAKSALAHPLSTEALDAYVASKLPAWQPIETAPKDGTLFIAWDALHQFPIFDMRMNAKGELCANRTRWSGTATHWMPLPPSPKQKG